jgi:hypothetical protein
LSAAFDTEPDTMPRSAAGIFIPGMFCCWAWPALAVTAHTIIGTTATARGRARLHHVVDMSESFRPGLPSPEPSSNTWERLGETLKSS